MAPTRVTIRHKASDQDVIAFEGATLVEEDGRLAIYDSLWQFVTSYDAAEFSYRRLRAIDDGDDQEPGT
jgi:hypothetical protein